MRKIYIASDGGGTKLELGAVSAEGRILTTVRVDGGINKKTADDADIEKTVRAGFDALEKELGEFTALGCAGYFMHNTDVFSRVFGCEAKEVDEGTLGLYAAGIYGDGVLILSGTGADTYIVRDGETLDIIGGYGAFLGDPGSGFAIGRAAVNAAAADYEGRGEKTLLTRYLTEKYPADTFRGSVYGIYKSGQTSRNIADFCRECEKAADEGDKIAINIFKEAADDLASFALAGYKKHGLDRSTPFSFAGGVIKHDISRKKPLMLPHILSALGSAGITNYIPPKTTPVLAAAEWIKIKLLG